MFAYMPSTVRPQYNTAFRHFCTAVRQAECPYAKVPQLDEARLAIARRADWLVGRQRRHHSPTRAQEISELQGAYRLIVKRMLDLGWR